MTEQTKNILVIAQKIGQRPTKDRKKKKKTAGKQRFDYFLIIDAIFWANKVRCNFDYDTILPSLGYVALRLFPNFMIN